MAPTEKEPAMPPTLKMATAKLHTIVMALSLKGSPYRSIDTFRKKMRSLCRTDGIKQQRMRYLYKIYDL